MSQNREQECVMALDRFLKQNFSTAEVTLRPKSRAGFDFEIHIPRSREMNLKSFWLGITDEAVATLAASHFPMDGRLFSMIEKRFDILEQSSLSCDDGLPVEIDAAMASTFVDEHLEFIREQNR